MAAKTIEKRANRRKGTEVPDHTALLCHDLHDLVVHVLDRRAFCWTAFIAVTGFKTIEATAEGQFFDVCWLFAECRCLDAFDICWLFADRVFGGCVDTFDVCLLFVLSL